MDEDAARRRLTAAPVARLATAGADGRPHVVPVCFAVDGDRIVSSVDAKPKRGRDLKRLRNVAANPRVALLVDHYEDDWTRVWWVRADGTGRVVDGGADADRAHDLLRAKYAPYRDGVDLLARVLVIDVDAWRGWSFS